MAEAPQSRQPETPAQPSVWQVNRDEVINPEDVVFVGHEGDNPPADEEPLAAADFTIEEANSILDSIRIREKREDARGRLAVLFTMSTFLLFVLGFIVAIVGEGNKVDNLKEVLITVSGIFSGLLGFVIGFYFRRSEDS